MAGVPPQEATMERESAPSPPGAGTSKSYRIGDIGAQARVQVGEHQTMIGDTLAALPDGETLARQFDALVARLEAQPDLDEDTRTLAVEKTEAVAAGLAHAADEPGALRRALVDAKQFLGGVAGWAWNELTDILKSEAAQKTLATVTEASTRAAIKQLTGLP